MRWSVILAGGRGKRLEPLTRQLYADERPKQFCVLGGGSRTMLEQAVERARLFSPIPRIFVSLSRQQVRWHAILDAYPNLVTEVEAVSRGTGAAVLGASLAIVRRDRSATIAVFPSDHYVSDERRFTSYVRRAAQWVEGARDDLVLLGVEPDYAESDYGWLIPRERGRPLDVPVPVTLVEKPSEVTALRLLRSGALWNTSVLVCRADTALGLFEVLAPEWLRSTRHGPRQHHPTADEAYAQLGHLDLSSDILAPAPRHLKGLAVRGVIWSDWGVASRIRRTLMDLNSPSA